MTDFSFYGSGLPLFRFWTCVICGKIFILIAFLIVLQKLLVLVNHILDWLFHEFLSKCFCSHWLLGLSLHWGVLDRTDWDWEDRHRLLRCILCLHRWCVFSWDWIWILKFSWLFSLLFSFSFILLLFEHNSQSFDFFLGFEKLFYKTRNYFWALLGDASLFGPFVASALSFACIFQGYGCWLF
jgi:hypothetical protein